MFTVLYVNSFLELGNSCFTPNGLGCGATTGFVNDERELMMIHSIKVIYLTNRRH